MSQEQEYAATVGEKDWSQRPWFWTAVVLIAIVAFVLIAFGFQRLLNNEGASVISYLPLL
jgi:hypothetical protein